MAITTYAELATTVASWLHRTDLAAQIVDFISLAEDEINTDMRLRLMESDESLTLLINTRTIALPTRFIEPIKLELTFTGRQNEELTYLTPSQMNPDPSTGAKYQPEFYTINGANIEFRNSADQSYGVTFRMLKGFDLANTSTNSLLSAYPGLYLYGALLQASAFTVNDDRIATWAKMYLNLKTKVNRIEARTKTLATLRTDVPMGQDRNNIFKG